MTLSDFYAIEGLLIGIIGAYFLIKPFINRKNIYQIPKKRLEQLKFLEGIFEESRQYVDKVNAKYVDRKETDRVQWIEGAIDLLHVGHQRTAAEIRLIDYDFSIRDLLRDRFENYVERDAKKGFIIIVIGASLEIASIIIN